MKYLYSSKIILIFILLAGLFFRLYKLEIFYPWGHDQDLFAWIAKDIVVDHHFRLIGQETSITGVFIGPLFYYLIALSFGIFNMNPLSAALITTIVSLATIFSIYWVFRKLFSRNVGLIGSFLYAISPGVVFLDRWVVPTQPTILWAVWFLYVLLSILKGNFQILILLSILIGLILHIHIAFIPLLVLLPIAYFLTDKRDQWFKYSFKTLTISLLIIFTLLSPFVIFETRHGFQQTKSIFSATYQDRGDTTGVNRLFKVINLGGRSLSGAFVLSNTVIELPPTLTSFLPLLLLLGMTYLWRCRIFSKKQIALFTCWYVIVFLGQFISKRAISEYYFNNLFVILFLTIALLFNQIKIIFKKWPVVEMLLIGYATISIIWFITRPDDLGGYLYKRQAIEFIKSNADSRRFSCIAVNFIEGQPGGATGFRYLFWLNNLSVITAGNDVPVYSVVEPWKISEKEVSVKFGNLGVIAPAAKKVDQNICSKPDRQLLPLWGFNN